MELLGFLRINNGKVLSTPMGIVLYYKSKARSYPSPSDLISVEVEGLLIDFKGKYYKQNGK